MFYKNPYMNIHFPASSYIITCFPAYMLFGNTGVTQDWIKQAYSLANSKPLMMKTWQEKPDDYAATQILPHYNYPDQTIVHHINPEDYYSLS